MKISIDVVIPNALLANLLSAALESGSAHWIRKALPLDWRRPEGSRLPWYSDESFFDRPSFAFRVWHEKPGEFGWTDDLDVESTRSGEMLDRDVSAADLQEGLRRMFVGAPREFAELMEASVSNEQLTRSSFYARRDGGLAQIGDMLLQFAILGRLLDY